MTRKLLFFLSVIALGLQGCAEIEPRQKPTPVTPGQVFGSSYLSVKAPNSAGWHLIKSPVSWLVLAKAGQAGSETFVGEVSVFNIPPTNTPQEFEAWVKNSMGKYTDPKRFDTHQTTFKYSSERNYPCVRHHGVLQDNAPQEVKGPLQLEVVALFCKHPIVQDTGFEVSYSYRGEGLYANLQNEAENFIQGAQVPNK